MRISGWDNRCKSYTLYDLDRWVRSDERIAKLEYAAATTIVWTEYKRILRHINNLVSNLDRNLKVLPEEIFTEFEQLLALAILQR